MNTHETISCGNLEKRTRLYVEATQKDMLPGVDLVILDIDNTLVKPRDADFYKQYGNAVNSAASNLHNVSLEEGTIIADGYRKDFNGRGEMALFSDTNGAGMELLYDEMCAIDIAGQFSNDGITPALIKLLRSQGKIVVAITDSPEGLSRRVLEAAGINPDDDFDMYVPYTKADGPPKTLKRERIFAAVADLFEIPSDRILSIGDSQRSDIEPAQQLGMQTCLIAPNGNKDHAGLQAENFSEAFEAYRNNL